MASTVSGHLDSVDGDAAREYVLGTLQRYWPRDRGAVARLRFPRADQRGGRELPPRLLEVALPDWARRDGVGALQVPAHALLPGASAAWERTDWLGAAFWYLNATAEREHEAHHGPIHSYAWRLHGWPGGMWDRAWVNRIALFLRGCAARARGVTENEAFGHLPRPEILLTHDVDAIEKTLAIRLKQSLFHVFNAVRRLARADLAGGASKLREAARFATSRADYWNFPYLEALEGARGWRSHFNIYAGGGGWLRTPLALLMDPGYDVAEPRVASLLRELHARGNTIGLHQSFGAWHDDALMQREKRRLEAALGAEVRSCRQHWLRFSWKSTWRAQCAAGFTLDTTLGFNDRPGFRNAAALQFTPFDASVPSGPLQVVPMVLMDSHVYDYSSAGSAGRAAQIQCWLDEVVAVSGQAAVNWHVHTLADDYGWREGYEELAAALANRLSAAGAAA